MRTICNGFGIDLLLVVRLGWQKFARSVKGALGPKKVSDSPVTQDLRSAICDQV